MKKAGLKKQKDSGLKDKEYDIISAVRNNDTETVIIALEDNPDCIFNTDRNKMNALHWAASNNDYEISEILFKVSGVEKIREAKDRFGREPIQLANATGHEELIELYFQNIFPEVYEHDDPYNSEDRAASFPDGSDPS